MQWFAVPTDKHLTALSLAGQFVFGINAENALELRGETSGSVFITPDQITRIRVGFYETRNGKFYVTTLWTTLLDKPVALRPTKATQQSYSLVITQFVELMIASNVADRIETGSTKFDALFGATLMGVPAVLATLVSLFVLTNEPWWGRLLVPAIPLALFALLIWMGWTKYWPRPLLDTRVLPKFLPKR